ncbi:MAG: hypothetical protein ASARMPREDX12_008223 [Alectoria sarmentosa]|nr:MAG: hypothetical protein ASARMPREDX12_008223 [Alectoria sarmentosa]
MLSHPRSCLPVLSAFALFLNLTCTANPASLSSYTKDGKGINLISTTPNQAPGHGTSVHDRLHNASSMTPLPPRSLSWENLNGSWNLVFNDWEAFPPSSATAKAMSGMYAAMETTLVTNRSELMTPAEALSLTYGGLRVTFHAVQQAIPWDTVEHFLRSMRDLARVGLTGLFTVAVYYLKGSIVWSTVMIVLILMPNAPADVTQNMIT